MTLNKIEFNKQLESNSEKFSFKYVGIPANNNIDNENIQELLNKFMKKYHKNMFTNVKFLRTILKDYTEKKLIISYQDDKKEETITYTDSEITTYKKIDKEKKYNVSYIPGNKINFTFNDEKKSTQIITDLPKEINETLEEINNLKQAKKMKLTSDIIRLIEIYKLFYDETPDFSSNYINIKIQTMLSILEEFKINISNYRVSNVNSGNIPISFYLSSIIYELFPYGKINNTDTKTTIPENEKKKISIIGKEIRNTIGTDIEALITISMIVYAASYNLSSTTNKNSITKGIDCSQEKVEDAIKLVKKINQKLNN